MNTNLNTIVNNEEQNYWKSVFSNEVVKSYFPYDHNNYIYEKKEMDLFKFEIEDDTYERIIRLSNGSDYRLYMILVAGLAATLYKYTKHNNIVVGTPVFIKKVEANYINTMLALSNKVDGTMTFRELLIKMRQNIEEVNKFQNYPIQKILYNLNLSEYENDFPLFDIYVLLENIQDKSLINEANVNFSISFNKNDCGISGEIQYNKKVYKKSSIERICRNFIGVITKCINDVNITMESMDVMSEDERKNVLFNFNDTLEVYKNAKPIHNLFEEQVNKTPNATALIINGNIITYSQLNGKANALAQKLIDKGIQKGQYIPVLMTRSYELVISIIAIMKAGGTYVPLDINWPFNRLNEVIREINGSIIIVDRKVELLKFEGTESIVVDESLLCNKESNLNININLEDSIYVIYTSGSSGKPKGAINKYEGIVNRFLYMNERYNICEHDAIILTSNHVFDASIWQLLWPLINGAKLVIPPHSRGFDIESIISLIDSEKVTITDFVPSMFNILTNIISKNNELRYKLKSLRQLLIGGEVMNPEIIYRFKKLLPNVSITNTYGPSETSIGTIFYEVSDEYKQVIPIGKPISNVKVLILDERNQPVPIGVEGEIFLGGKCVGLGYVNDEVRTKNSFIKLNIDGYEEQVFYRTGDLGRWLHDGNIEFLGRKDKQVKIRGLRIELGEIESQLLKINSIEQVKVIVTEEDTNMEKKVCIYAYYVSKENYTSNELKELLAKYLPSYMIPNFFMKVENIPLTYNGKIDESALPQPTFKNKFELVKPRNKDEEVLVQVWSNLLGIQEEEISIEDDFFEKGGHSLLITIMVSEIKDKYHINIPLDKAFEKTTIRELANYIRSINKSIVNKKNNLFELKRLDDCTDNLFVIHDGDGNIETYLEFCKNLKCNVFAIKAITFEDIAPKNYSIKNIARDYINKIKEIQPNGPYNIAGWCVGGTIAFEMSLQLENIKEKVNFIGLIDCIPPNYDNKYMEFNIDSEVELVKEYILENSLLQELKKVSDIGQFWSFVSSNVEHFDIIKIKEFIIKNLDTGFNKDLDNTDSNELIKKINTTRTFTCARDRYIPTKKLDTRLQCFIAKEKKVKNIDVWKQYCKNGADFYEIDGNHKSILQGVNAVKFANIFNESYTNFK